MIFGANFLLAVARILHIVLTVFIWIVIFRAVLSWIQVPALHSLAVVVFRLTEPVLRPLRRILPPSKTGGLDVSPMLLILILLFIDTFLVKSLSLHAQQILRRQIWDI